MIRKTTHIPPLICMPWYKWSFEYLRELSRATRDTSRALLSMIGMVLGLFWEYIGLFYKWLLEYLRDLSPFISLTTRIAPLIWEAQYKWSFECSLDLEWAARYKRSFEWPHERRNISGHSSGHLTSHEWYHHLSRWQHISRHSYGHSNIHFTTHIN